MTELQIKTVNQAYISEEISKFPHFQKDEDQEYRFTLHKSKNGRRKCFIITDHQERNRYMFMSKDEESLGELFLLEDEHFKVELISEFNDFGVVMKADKSMENMIRLFYACSYSS